MVKQKITFSPKIWDSFVKSQILGIKKIGGQNIETRYSIYEAFGMGGLAWGATWDPFFRKMFGFGKSGSQNFKKNMKHGPKWVYNRRILMKIGGNEAE